MLTFKCSYLMMVGMISAVKRMQREAVAWEEKRPSTEKTVMAVSLRSNGEEEEEEEGQASAVMDHTDEAQRFYFSDDVSPCCFFSVQATLRRHQEEVT